MLLKTVVFSCQYLVLFFETSAKVFGPRNSLAGRNCVITFSRLGYVGRSLFVIQL